MMELYIEGQQMDVDQTFSALLTKAIDDIRDFGSKNTTFSKTIILPGTKGNNKRFGNIFQINSGAGYDSSKPNVGYNFNAAIQASAVMFTGNIQSFKGVLRLLRVVIDKGAIEYECAVFGELGGFVAKMGNGRLQELDFSAYDHVYSIANITASWDNAAGGSGYYYGHVDYGGYSTNKRDFRVGTFRPAMAAAEYIDKIFEAAGYTYDCALFATERFRRQWVPHNQKILTADNTNLIERYSPTNTSTGTTATLLQFNGTGGTLGAFTTVDDRSFVFANATTVTADLYLNIILDYTNFPTDTLTLQVRKNGTPLYTTSFNLPPAADVNVTGVTLTTGDVLDFRISGLSVTETLTYEAWFNMTSFSSVPTPIQIGDTVRMNNCIPKGVLQKDFLSSILKIWNMYAFEDYDRDRHLVIMPFIDFYAGADTVDWSAKVDRDRPLTITPMSELNARYFEFAYKPDSDYYNDLYRKRYQQGYGDYRYDSAFEFAKEVQRVEVIFSGTPLVGYASQGKVYSTIFKWNGGIVGTGEEQVDSNIRLLQAKKITGVPFWDIKSHDGATTLATLTSYGYLGHLNDPDAPANDNQFGVPQELFFVLATGALNVNQFNVYWSPYMAEITDKDSRLLNCTMRLEDRDVYRLDFSTLIYIDGVLYRINKITDFNASKPDTCGVELLKIINRIY